MIQVYQESTPFTNTRVGSPVSQNTFLNPVIVPFALNTTLGTNVLETVFYIKNDSIQNYYTDIVVSLMKEDDALSTMLSNGTIDLAKNTFAVNSYTNVPISLAFPYSTSPNTLSSQYKHNYVPITSDYLLTNQFVGNTTNGGYYVTGIATSGYNVTIGDMVSGPNIQDGTTVVNIIGSQYNLSTYQLQLSKPALSTQTAAILSITTKTDNDIRVKFSYGYDQISDYNWSNLSSVLVIPYIGNATTPDTTYIPVRMRIEWITPPSVYTVRKYWLDVSYAVEGMVVA